MTKQQETTQIQMGDFKALPEAIYSFFEFLLSIQTDGVVYCKYFPDKLDKLKDLYKATIEAIRAIEPETLDQRRQKLKILGYVAANDENYRETLGDEINALIKTFEAGIGQNGGVNTPKEKKRTVGAKKGA